MVHSHHGKDGRFRDSTGLISFEYDRNDPRHIQQELNHPQLGHEGQYRNCWICHDYTPRRFRTYREVAADTEQDSHPNFTHQPRYHVLLREDVAAGMDPLSMQHFWSPGCNRESNQRGPDYRADALLPTATRVATNLMKSKRSTGEQAPEGIVAGGASSVTEGRATRRRSAPHSEERSLCGSDAHEVIGDSWIDDAIAQILRNKAKIHEARATYHRSDGSRDAAVMVRRFVEKGFERQLEEMNMILDDLVNGVPAGCARLLRSD